MYFRISYFINTVLIRNFEHLIERQFKIFIVFFFSFFLLLHFYCIDVNNCYNIYIKKKNYKMSAGLFGTPVTSHIVAASLLECSKTQDEVANPKCTQYNS